METYKDHITMSPDMNAERLETLRQLFPDWFTQEGRLDINEVKKAVNPDNVDETERYEFRWFGKSKAKRNAFTPTRATLHYDAERSVNADKTENIIIEEKLELFYKYLNEKERQMTLAFNDNELITEILITRGFQLTYKLEKQESFTQNTVYYATDEVKTAYICVDSQLHDETVNYFMEHTDTKFICIERALDTTKKFNLKKKMGDKFFAF